MGTHASFFEQTDTDEYRWVGYLQYDGAPVALGGVVPNELAAESVWKRMDFDSSPEAGEVELYTLEILEANTRYHDYVYVRLLDGKVIVDYSYPHAIWRPLEAVIAEENLC